MEIPTTLVTILTRIDEAGGFGLLVGGSVRDEVLGSLRGTTIESKDLDVEVYGLSADNLRRVLEAFGRVNEVGQSFGVMKVRLEDGTDLDSERLAARIALVGAHAGAFAFQLADALKAAAVRADRAIRPNTSLYELVGGLFVVEIWC